MDIDYQTLLLELIASLTLCDHMGDAADEVATVLSRLGIDYGEDEDEDEDEDWWGGVGDAMHKLGIKTLCGISLGEDDD